MKQVAGLALLLAAGLACAAGERSAEQDAAVAYWTSGYTGAGLAADNFGCPAPEVPAVSHSNLQIRSIERAILAWEECHVRLVAGLVAPAAADARIPADLLALMTPAERDTARRHVHAVLVDVARAAETNSLPLLARHDAWRRATVEYIAQENDATARSRVNTARNQSESRLRQRSVRDELRESGPRLPGY